MYKKIIFLLLIYNPCLFAQISAYILDRETKKPVSYANIQVENEQIRTFANEDGKFILTNLKPEKRLVFTAVGYERFVIPIRDISDTVYLKPQAIELSEVRIIRRKNTRVFRTGNLKGELAIIRNYTPQLNNLNKLNSLAKFFPYIQDYKQTPFLKRIRIRTYSERNDNYLNLVFYSIGERGEPKDYLFNKNIICKISKGEDRVLSIDVSKLNIIIPAEGIFVGLEADVNNPIRSDGAGVVEVKDKINNDTWTTVNGIWEKWKYASCAMELELSN